MAEGFWVACVRESVACVDGGRDLKRKFVSMTQQISKNVRIFFEISFKSCAMGKASKDKVQLLREMVFNE